MRVGWNDTAAIGRRWISARHRGGLRRGRLHPGRIRRLTELTRIFGTIGYRMTAVAADATLLAEAAARATSTGPAISAS